MLTDWGGLTSVVWRPEDDAAPLRAAIVLCHGFGAPATDLVDLAPGLVQLQPSLGQGVLWVFPGAPLSLDRQGIVGGRAWWLIDMEALLLAVATGSLRELRGQTPAGLPAARESLAGLLADLKRDTGLDDRQLVLGGFSQGAMLTTDAALHQAEPPAALCVLSGSLICEAAWQPLAAQRPLRVFQSHGKNDPILPHENAVALSDLLQAGGSSVEFCSFRGEHGIPLEAIKRLGLFLATVVNDLG